MEENKNIRKDFLLEAYRPCFSSKHHYDLLSWSAAGVSLVIIGVIISAIPKVKAGTEFNILLVKIGLGIFAWFVIYIWYSIYQWNRFWAEVAGRHSMSSSFFLLEKKS